MSNSHSSGINVPPGERVPLREKLAYGAGGAGSSLCANADNAVYAPIFVVTLGMSPAIMSLRGVIERIWDAVTDLLMGWLTDNTRSRWGRRKPYVLIGGVLMSAWFPVVFFFDREWSLDGLAVWLILCGVIATTLGTMWNIPYQCQLLEITPNSVERTNVAVWKAYVGKASGLFIGWIWYLVQLPVFGAGDGTPDIINGSRWVMCGVAAVVMALVLLPLFVNERVRSDSGKKKVGNTELWHNIRLSFSNKPFVILLAFTLLFTLGFQLKAGLDFYTRLYYVFGGDQKAAAMLTGITSTLTQVIGILGIPVFQWIARKDGKRFALAVVMGIVFCASISTFFCYYPGLPYLSIVPPLLVAPANTALWVLIPSMTGDVVDYDETITHQRREGSFASTYSWFLKVAQTMAMAGSGPLVVWAGFDQTLSQQSSEVLINMRVLLVLVPMIFIGSAIWLILRYPLTTGRIAELHDELERRRAVQDHAV